MYGKPGQGFTSSDIYSKLPCGNSAVEPFEPQEIVNLPISVLFDAVFAG